MTARALVLGALAMSALGAALAAVTHAAGDDAPRAAAPGETNGPLAYQDSGGTVTITTVGTNESFSDEVNALRTAFPVKGTDPVWSPSGGRLAFVRRANGRRQIFLSEGDGTGVRRLTRDPVQASDPTWSPSGRRLAFTSLRDGHPEIYAIDVDGRDERRLTDDPAGSRQPDWSPEGQQIAFTTARAGSLDIWVMNPDGFDPRPVTALPGAESDPDVRPGGLQIAFAAETTAGDSDIRVIDTDGNGERPLTRGSATDRFPSWAPTGGAIAFTRGSGERRSTYVADTSAGPVQDARIEIERGVRASWGALPVAPADPAALAGDTVSVTPAAGDPTVSPPQSEQQSEVANEGARVPAGYVVHASGENEAVKLEADAAGVAPVDVRVAGTFEIQPRAAGDETAVTLRLRGAGPSCGGSGASAAAASAGGPLERQKKKNKAKKKSKQAKVKGKGKVKVVSKHAAGSTKATDWTIEETCEGTRIAVREGVVEVFDKGLGISVAVSAGDSYLARARP